MSNSKTSHNLRVAYALSFVSQLFFPIAVWLFFYSRYLDFKHIAIMTAIGSVCTVLFEIPTGAFADLVGRKTAIVLSYFLFSASMIATAVSQTFEVFAALTIMSALVNALYSGSLEALIYDTLKETRKEEEYDYVVARMESLAWIGLFVGSVTGGFLYTVSFQLPFFAQAIITFTAGIVALNLIEPHIDSTTYNLSDFVKQNIQGFHELFRSKRTAYLTFIFVTIGAGYDIAASILGISQAREYGISPEVVGIIFATGYIISAIASHVYPSLKKLFGGRILLYIATTALLSSFIFAQYTGALLGSFLIILRISSSTIFRNIRSTTFNPFFSSKNRATALSTLNLLTILPYAVLAYFIGSYIDSTSPNQFALILGFGVSGILIVGEFVRRYGLEE